MAAQPLKLITPIEVIDAKHRELRTYFERLLTQNDDLARREIDAHKRLDDAIDRVHELEDIVRGKDQLIEELQAMNRARVSR